MAISQINKAWKFEALKEPRMVLIALALADWANEEGWCWPSMDSLGDRARCSARTARRLIHKMQALGMVEIEEHRGRHNTNRYRVLFEAKPVKFELKHDIIAPILPTEKTDKSDQKPDIPAQNRTNGAQKPDKTVSAEPSVNHQIEPKEPSIEIPDWIPSDLWADYYEYRRKSKLPVTDRVKRMHIRKLGDLRARGHTPESVLETAIERGWKGIFEPEVRSGHGQQTKAEQRRDSNLRNAAEAIELLNSMDREGTNYSR